MSGVAGSGRMLAAALVTAATVVMTAVVVVLLLLADVSVVDLLESYTIHNVLAAATAPLGLLLLYRTWDRQPVAWTLVLAGPSSALTAIAAMVVLGGIADAVARGADLSAPMTEVFDPIVLGAAWLKSWTWIPGPAILFTALVLVFPDRGLQDAASRAIVGAVVLGTGSLMVGIASVVPVGLRALPGSAIVDANRALGEPTPLMLVGVVLILGSAFVSSIAVVVRYRRARGIVRLQLRWLAFGAFVSVVALIAALAWDIAVFRVVSFFVIPVVPIAIAIAILRYRLYDIDRIVSRTIAYAIVTATLFAVFGGAILVLQGLLGGLTQGDTLAVAASTLLAAAAFQPVRRRVQDTIDRRFNRAGVDAQRAIDAFGAGLRDEVDLDQVHGRLVAAATQVVEPLGAAVWIREQGR